MTNARSWSFLILAKLATEYLNAFPFPPQPQPRSPLLAPISTSSPPYRFPLLRLTIFGHHQQHHRPPNASPVTAVAIQPSSPFTFFHCSLPLFPFPIVADSLACSPPVPRYPKDATASLHSSPAPLEPLSCGPALLRQVGLCHHHTDVDNRWPPPLVADVKPPSTVS